MGMSAGLNPERGAGRPVSASIVTTAEIVQPFDTNVHGSVFGGHLMSLVDKAAGIAAYRHSGRSVVTASVDQLVFRHVAPVGTILTIKASVNRVFTTSMEVGVRVTGIMPGTTEEILICPAYLTFVALGDDGRPVAVVPVIPESTDELRRYREAGLRREARLALNEALKNHR